MDRSERRKQKETKDRSDRLKKEHEVAKQRNDRAVELKREQPQRSDEVINRILKSQFGSRLMASTALR